MNIIKLAGIALIGILLIDAAFIGNPGSMLASVLYPAGMMEGGVNSFLADTAYNPATSGVATVGSVPIGIKPDAQGNCPFGMVNIGGVCIPLG